MRRFGGALHRVLFMNGLSGHASSHHPVLVGIAFRCEAFPAVLGVWVSMDGALTGRPLKA